MDSSYIETVEARRVREDLQRAAAEETPSVIAIVGIAGIGKSTLLRRLEAQLRTQGHYAFYASARYTRGFGGLLSWLTRELLHNVESSEGLSALLPISTTNRLAAILSHRISDRDEQAAEVLNDIADTLPPGRSLILLLDDLDLTEEHHRLSRFIKNLAHRGSRKIQVVLAMRSFTFELSPSLSRVIRTYQLERFSHEEAVRFVAQALPGELRDRSDLASFVATAGGNPLFLSLMVKWMEEGHQPPSGTPLSDQMADMFDSVLPTDVLSRRVIELLALLGPVGESELCDMTGVSVEHLNDVVEPLVRRGLVENSDSVFFTHMGIAEHLRRRITSEIPLDPGRLEFGAEEAERDRELLSSLVRMPWVATLLNGNKSIVLGDRGAGKSAVFRLLSQSPECLPDQIRPNVAILAEKNPGAFVQRMIAHNPEVSSAERFKAVWLTLVAVLIAGRLVADQAEIERGLRRRAQRLAELGGVRKPSRLRRLASLVGGLKLTFGPVTLEPADGKWSLLGATVDVESFLADSAAFLSEADRRFLVMVDRVDEVYKYQRDVQEALVQGLFLAESHLGSFERIDVVVLLRTDLFEIYDIQEKNKFQSRMLTLTWDDKDIVLALLKRLYTNPALLRLATRLGIDPHGRPSHRAAALRLVFPVEIESEDFEPWFLQSMRNGRGRISPRQAILFLNAARDYLRDKGSTSFLVPLFSLEAVREAMSRVSELSHEEVVSDFRIATTLVRNCRAGRISEFMLDEVDHLIDPNEGSRTEQIERLEELGFLRRVVRMNDSGVRTTHFVVPELYTRCWGGEDAVS